MEGQNVVAWLAGVSQRSFFIPDPKRMRGISWGEVLPSLTLRVGMVLTGAQVDFAGIA
jgi:hypothetical protein